MFLLILKSLRLKSLCDVYLRKTNLMMIFLFLVNREMKREEVNQNKHVWNFEEMKFPFG